jgi:hypothetical protein
MSGMAGEIGTEVLIILTLLMLWTLPWKGWAMWRAVMRGEKGWFIAFLILNTFAILELIYLFIVTRDEGDREPDSEEEEHEANDAGDDVGTSDEEDNAINPTHDPNYRLPGY